MQVKNRWVAFYSQTGSEIKELIKRDLIPDVVITDSFVSYLKNLEFFKQHGVDHKITKIEGTKQDKISQYNQLLRTNDLVTLHGWLNIIPGDICEQYTIYNGHPGHIVEYPELKGKDPQERVWKQIETGKAPKKVGSVVHRVTKEVDGGEVVVVMEMSLDRKVHIGSLDGMFHVNSYLSRISWEEFFRNLDIILREDLNPDGTSDRTQQIPFIFRNHE